MPIKVGEDMSKSNFIVRGGADFSAIPKALQKLQGQFNGFGKTLGAGLKVAAASFVAKKLLEFGKEAVQVASDLQEVQNVVDVTFGSMSKQVNDFASDSIEQFGLSELSAKKFSSTMGAMLKSSGLSGQAVTDMSIEVAKLTADMASFYNLDAEEAFTKIRSGLSGETEPLKQLGINMSVANIEAFALSQGINKAWREMTQAEQTMLRYNYLLSATGDAQGDFARNSGSWANQIKILKEQWKEFMGLIGKALIEILLPIVKVLNTLLGYLIDIVKEIGKIYTMITGKQIVVEANNTIGDTAMDAAEGEEELADGIGKAAKAAKGALASFDEINQLQDSIGSGSGALGNALGALSTGEINTKMNTKTVDDGWEIRIDDEEPKAFFIWFENKWKYIRQMMAVPLFVPAPIFAKLPEPIYEPEWNLTPPLVPRVVIPPVYALEYEWSLENLKLKTTESFAIMQKGVLQRVVDMSWLVLEQYNLMNLGIGEKLFSLETNNLSVWERIRQESQRVSEVINNGLSTAWATMESNYTTHKGNVGVISTAIATTLVANMNAGLSKLGTNVNNTIAVVQNNLQTFGKNVGAISGEIAKSFSNNLREGSSVTSQNFATFANSMGKNMQSFGQGMLSMAAETARGFVNNMVSGFVTVWDNFKKLMGALGKKVTGFFSANKGIITTTAIVGGIALAGVGLALAAPAIIPYAAAALGGLATVPALAKGGITNGPMLAMIGDNPGGKEVVSPLDDLKGMIVEAVGTAILGTSQFNDNNNGGDIILQVDGTTFARVINPYNAKENQRIGNSVVIQTT